VIAERSTAVFTGLLSQKKSADYPYLTMDEDPLGSGSRALRWDRPPYEKLGREISFENLLRVAGNWCSTRTGSCGTCSVTKARFRGT
jgi:hypothetical protein